jgi:hypothetical protein
MAYYKDLTPYEYMVINENAKVLNVGWLERGQSFPTGKVDLDCLAIIGVLCKNPFIKTRGYHKCPFCSSASFGYSVTIDNHTLLLGSSEIRVHGESGILYAAPDLIYHYIRDHNYLPPDEFISAVYKVKQEKKL